MHERSETIQRPDGRWINVYGPGTPMAGQQIPGTSDYPDVEAAVADAKDRSQSFRKFEITSPDGRKFEVTAPEGATEQQVMEFVRQQGFQKFLGDVEAQTLERPAQTFGRALRGMRDPIDAGAQLLVRGAEKVGLAPQSEVERVDKLIRESEQEYQQNRAPGLDVPRIAGNILSPANLAIASRIPRAASLVGRTVQGGLAGGAFGALQPVTEGDFGQEKKRQIATGVTAGAILPSATGAVSRVIRPKSSPAIQNLMKEGVTPTPGQMAGGFFKRAEEGLSSVPLLGDAILVGQRRAMLQFNRAAIDRALKPIGSKLPKNVEVGNKAVEFAGKKISGAYDKLLPKLNIKADNAFTQEVNTVRQMARNMHPAQARQFENILSNNVIRKFTPQGRMRPETMKQVESDLGRLIRRFGRSENPNDQMLSDALQETQAALRRMVVRHNPQYGQELKKVNEAYANLLRVENAASRLGSKEGVFSPAGLRGAVRGTDPSLRKRQFARGNALMQDLAESGESALGRTVPDSGTPFRSLMSTGPLGLGVGMVSSPLGLTYTPPVQKLAAALLGQRPSIATPVAQAVRQSTPYLLPGVLSGTR